MSFDKTPHQGTSNETAAHKLHLRNAGFERAFRQLNAKLPIADVGPEVPALKDAARRMIEDALAKLAEVEPVQAADLVNDSDVPFTLRLVGTWEEDATDAA